MSVIALPLEHIRAMLHNAGPLDTYYYNGKHTRFQGNENYIGQLLIDENYKSYNARYQHRIEEPAPPPRYRHTLTPKKNYSPTEVIKAAQSYEYQTCESPTWESSEARAVTESIIDHATRRLPEWESAEWVEQRKGTADHDHPTHHRKELTMTR